MVVTRLKFPGVVENAFCGLGFSNEGPWVYEFPLEMFLAGSDLSPINENIDKIVYGLTKWQPEITKPGIISPPKVTVKGKDYQEAVANMNDLFLENWWGDGLPLLPATKERVDWILTGTSLSPDKEIGRILPRGGIATVRDIAISLAMAGGLPEYLPVLIAMVEAIIPDDFQLVNIQPTTNPVTPVFIINGPIAKELNINSSSGCLGPGWQANATIGRASRLLMINLGAAVPDLTDMATQGQPGKYTNFVFAEREEESPWEPLNVGMGYKPGTSTVSAVSTQGNIHINIERDAVTIMDRLALDMSIPLQYSRAVTFILNPTAAKIIAGEGWSKQAVRQYLWENTWRSAGRHIVDMPERIVVVVAGGPGGLHNTALWGWSDLVIKEIHGATLTKAGR